MEAGQYGTVNVVGVEVVQLEVGVAEGCPERQQRRRKNWTTSWTRICVRILEVTAPSLRLRLALRLLETVFKRMGMSRWLSDEVVGMFLF